MAMKRDLNTLSLDVLALTMNSAKLSHDLRLTMRFLEALAVPANGPAFDKALLSMKREGDPEITTSSLNPDDPHEIEVDVKLTFTEESLAEALRVAISEYNYETVANTNQLFLALRCRGLVSLPRPRFWFEIIRPGCMISNPTAISASRA